jgi:ribosomal protein S18 acetylase RimI-like enzyme
MRIRPYEDGDADAVVRLSLRAWAPVFASLKQALNPEVYREFYPNWRASQREAVEAACADPAAQTWVGEEEGAPVAFVTVRLHPDVMGEIHMLAVDPGYQQRGIGAALTAFALERIKAAGKTVAMVETGGDPGHAPARQTYEKCGFELFAVSRYFKKL